MDFNWIEARVEVKTHARNNFLQITAFEEHSLRIDLIVHTTEKPMDGQANKSIIEIIAQHFNLPKSQISLTKGKKSCIKWFEYTPR